MAFDDAIDISNPENTETTRLGDDRIREAKRGWQQFLAINHNADLTGNVIDSATSGFHTIVHLIEQSSAPTAVADTGVLYTKDSSTITELFYKDSGGSEVQFTIAGLIKLTSASLLGILANDTYLSAVDNAGTGTVNMIKVGTNDLPTLLDASEMASSAAPTEDEAIVNKLYVDDQIGSLISVVSDIKVNNNTPSVTLTLTAGTWFIETTVFATGGNDVLDRNIKIDGATSGTFEGATNQSGNVTGFGIGYKELTTAGGDVICTVSGALTNSLFRNSILAAKAMRIGPQ